MKLLYQRLFLLGLGLAVSGAYLWAKAGFPFNIRELSTTLFGTRPWHLGSDSYFFVLVAGVLISAYAAVELNLRRWEKNCD